MEVFLLMKIHIGRLSRIQVAKGFSVIIGKIAKSAHIFRYGHKEVIS
jgi:hypothetical protein